MIFYNRGIWDQKFLLAVPSILENCLLPNFIDTIGVETVRSWLSFAVVHHFNYLFGQLVNLRLLFHLFKLLGSSKVMNFLAFKLFVLHKSVLVLQKLVDIPGFLCFIHDTPIQK